MLTDYQIKSFEHYVKTTPKHLLGVYPLTPQGAYDALTGAKGHGFGQRRGIPYRAFSRGGAFDYAQNGENNAENAKSEADRGLPKSGQVWKKLERYLSPLLDTQQMSEVGQMLEDFARHCGVEAKAEDDGEEDMEGMDKPRRARDDPPPFANGGRPNPGGRVDPANPMMGRAGDSRNRLAADGKARASFDALFPNASKLQHV
jgi:hypothetical protein